MSVADSAMNHLAKLPNETISEIFVEWINDYWSEKARCISSRDECGGAKPQIYLSSVCRLFYNIVRSTPRLWRRITLESDKDMEEEYRWARVCFRLSRVCQLDILVDWTLLDEEEEELIEMLPDSQFYPGRFEPDDVVDLMSVLSPQSNRCTSLSLHICPCKLALKALELLPIVSALKTLSISALDAIYVDPYSDDPELCLPDLHVVAPNIRLFEISGFPQNWEHLSAHNLTTLRLSRIPSMLYITLVELRAIFVASPELECLELEDVSIHEEGPRLQLNLPRVHLHALAELRIWPAYAEDVVDIVSLISASALRTLGLDIAHWDLEDGFSSVISALVACTGSSYLHTVTKLEISNFWDASPRAELLSFYKALFQAVPNVESLVLNLRRVPWGDVNDYPPEPQKVLTFDTLVQAICAGAISAPLSIDPDAGPVTETASPILPQLKSVQVSGKSAPAEHRAWDSWMEAFLKARHQSGLGVCTLTLTPGSWAPEDLETFVPWVGRIGWSAGYAYYRPTEGKMPFSEWLDIMRRHDSDSESE